MLMGD